MNNRNQNIYRLGITPQVCYLEKFLNDRYDNVLRRIRIVDAQQANITYLFLRTENSPLYIYTRAEKKPLYLYSRSEIIDIETDFIIQIPANVTFDEKQVRGEIDSYKLAGKKYQIIIT